MNRQDQISSFLWLLMGLFIIIVSVFSLSIGTVADPGPGLFPLIMGVALSSLSLVILIKSTFEKSIERKTLDKLWTGLKWPKMFYTIGALLVYIIILDKIGFLLTTFFLLIFLMRVIEPQKWRLVIGLSILASVGSYVLFGRLLEMELPTGFIGF